MGLWELWGLLGPTGPSSAMARPAFHSAVNRMDCSILAGFFYTASSRTAWTAQSWPTSSSLCRASCDSAELHGLLDSGWLEIQQSMQFTGIATGQDRAIHAVRQTCNQLKSSNPCSSLVSCPSHGNRGSRAIGDRPPSLPSAPSAQTLAAIIVNCMDCWILAGCDSIDLHGLLHVC